MHLCKKFQFGDFFQKAHQIDVFQQKIDILQCIGVFQFEIFKKQCYTNKNVNFVN